MGVESATVVGPAGDEIHTDEFGRVRVHFHWDRESQMNEKSSCWIHVSQSWGGTGYGGVNLPRIGQEVLVDFLGGDPDRPIITGRVYTNLQKVPYPLPANKTQSGWRSNSTNQTGGYNEMMFEDASGQELLRMQAEKDMHKLVKNDEESHVGRDRARSVQRDESVSVGNDRSKQVQKTERVTIGQNHNIAVGVNHTHQVGNNHTTIVGVKHLVMIAPPGEGPAETASSWTLTKDKIVLDTGSGGRSAGSTSTRRLLVARRTSSRGTTSPWIARTCRSRQPISSRSWGRMSTSSAPTRRTSLARTRSTSRGTSSRSTAT
jgi:type VI secretion system secreted protein VgrG